MKLYSLVVASGLLLNPALQASLTSIQDDSGINKFLGSTISACSYNGSGCNTGDVTTSTIYVDQRQSLDGFLGINFAQYSDRVIYLFNEFGYWSAQREQYGNDISSSSVYANNSDKLAQDVQAKYPGEGVYIVAISAIPSFVNRVGKNVPCPKGQIKVAAILLYDNGIGLQPLSASCIAISPKDTFSLHVSSNNNGAVKLPHGVTAFSGVLTSSTSGSVNFQASQITVSQPSSGKDANKNPSDAGSLSNASKDLVPTISLGGALNLGSSPQSISLKKG